MNASTKHKITEWTEILGAGSIVFVIFGIGCVLIKSLFVPWGC